MEENNKPVKRIFRGAGILMGVVVGAAAFFNLLFSGEIALLLIKG